MEFKLVTKSMKKLLYILISFMMLFFVVIFVLMINDDIRKDAVNVLFYIVLGAFVTFFIILSYVIQRSDWAEKKGKFTVNEKGVEYRARAIVHFIPWDKAKYVIIGGRNPFLTIYIQTDTQRQKYEKGRKDFPYYEWNMMSPGITSDDMVCAPYSPEALEEIKKYHKKQIVNEYLLHMRRWIT